jgi:hypothetical protein
MCSTQITAGSNEVQAKTQGGGEAKGEEHYHDWRGDGQNGGVRKAAVVGN